MITHDPKNDICRQLEKARDDLEFSLYLATDCAKEGRAMLTDNQYDEIKDTFGRVNNVLNTLRSR